jgi:hypothetical protein
VVSWGAQADSCEDTVVSGNHAAGSFAKLAGNISASASYNQPPPIRVSQSVQHFFFVSDVSGGR